MASPVTPQVLERMRQVIHELGRELQIPQHLPQPVPAMPRVSEAIRELGREIQIPQQLPQPVPAMPRGVSEVVRDLGREIQIPQQLPQPVPPMPRRISELLQQLFEMQHQDDDEMQYQDHEMQHQDRDRYGCHTCLRFIWLSPTEARVCPNCNGEFIEEIPVPRTDIRDYYNGPNMDRLIERISRHDRENNGTPPASREAIEALVDVKVSEELLASDNSHCAVCQDMFELQEDAKQMPCKHVYHQDCLLTWLKMHNSCPVCRFELPTEDPHYENHRRGIQGSDGSDNSRSSSGNGDY